MNPAKSLLIRSSIPAIMVVAFIVGAALALLVVVCMPRAVGAVLEGQDSVNACKAGCDSDNMVHVQKDMLVQLLQEREMMKARINEVELLAERAIKARDVALRGCSA